MSLKDLGQKSENLKCFEWIPGMLDLNGDRVLSVEPDFDDVFTEFKIKCYEFENDDVSVCGEGNMHPPDFRDTSTRLLMQEIGRRELGESFHVVDDGSGMWAPRWWSAGEGWLEGAGRSTAVESVVDLLVQLEEEEGND